MITLSILGAIILAILYVIWFTEKPSFMLGTIYAKYRFGYDINWLTLAQVVSGVETGLWKFPNADTYRKNKNALGMDYPTVRKSSAIGRANTVDPFTGNPHTIARYRTFFDCGIDFFHYLNFHNVTKQNGKMDKNQAVAQGVKWMKDRNYFEVSESQYLTSALRSLQDGDYPVRYDWYLLGSMAALFLFGIYECTKMTKKFMSFSGFKKRGKSY